MADDDSQASTLGLPGRGKPAPQAAGDGLTLRIAGDGIFSTHALPRTGRLVLGRAHDADIRIDDPSISRKHAALELGPPLRVEDLGSVNGTKVGDRLLKQGDSAELSVGDVIDFGTVMAVVQPRVVSQRPRRVWAHGFFEGRLEEECDRAARAGTSFAICRIRVKPGSSAQEVEAALARILGSGDSLGLYGPGEYEVLFPEATPESAEGLANTLAALLRQLGIEVTLALACFPRDARSAEGLVARSNEKLRGSIAPAEATSSGFVLPSGAAMQRMYKLAERVAQGTISVLLLGETGVGKEVFAQTIHDKSPRAKKPFLKLNCAALAENLLESELFGHEKGAFTGAIAAKPGLLETAEGGTVFLDEIGEMPLSIQVKLLRVLEERKVTRVGGLKPKAIDVRFVAATNRDPDADVARGAFRQDLLYRINGMTLAIPPLRERTDEIEPLARKFGAAASRQSGRKREPSIAPEALDILRAYTWPGNIRELRNVMERAVLLCMDEEQIVPEHLPLEKMLGSTTIHAPSSSPSSPAPPPAAVAPAAQPGKTLHENVAALEKQRILDALDRCGGNQTRAAKMLGISRGTLLARLDEYGVPRPRK